MGNDVLTVEETIESWKGKALVRITMYLLSEEPWKADVTKGIPGGFEKRTFSADSFFNLIELMDGFINS